MLGSSAHANALRGRVSDETPSTSSGSSSSGRPPRRRRRRPRRPRKDAAKDARKGNDAPAEADQALEESRIDSSKPADVPLTPDEVAEMRVHLRFLRRHRKTLRLKLNATEDLLVNGAREPTHRGAVRPPAVEGRPLERDERRLAPALRSGEGRVARRRREVLIRRRHPAALPGDPARGRRRAARQQPPSARP